MALDKQKILCELGSVMNQLKSADCGCMGKLFNGGQQNTCMGFPLPTCNGCRHGCCQGHGLYMSRGGAGMGMNPACGMAMNPSGGMGMNPSGGMGMNPNGGMCAMNPNSSMGMDPSGGMGAMNPTGGMCAMNPNNGMGMDPSSGMGAMNPSCGMGMNPSPGVDMNPSTGMAMSPRGGMGMNPSSGMGGMNPTGGMCAMNPSGDMSAMHPSGGRSMDPYIGNRMKTVARLAGMNMNPNGDGGLGSNLKEEFQPLANLKHETPQMLQNTFSYLQQNLMKPVVNEMYQDLKSLSASNTVGNNPLAAKIPGLSSASPASAGLAEPITHGSGDPGMQPGFMGNNQMVPGTAATPRDGLGTQILNMMTSSKEGKSDLRPPTGDANPNVGTGHANAAMGLRNFNKIFPGVLPEGDLGFDPMSMAIDLKNQKANMRPQTDPGQQTVSPTGQARYQEIPKKQQQAPDSQSQQVYRLDLGNSQPGQIKQGQMLQQAQFYQQGGIPHQQLIDPNTGAPTQAGVTDDNHMQNLSPIYPVDNNNKTIAYAQPMRYNTLGQPVEVEDINKYSVPIPPLPHSLSPEDFYREGPHRVKNTMSITSLAPRRSIGGLPSQSQLRHIYRQYKAGHVDVQQTMKPPPPQSQSEGRLYPSARDAKASNFVKGQSPVDPFSGDTSQNNAQFEAIDKPQQHVVGQVGDVPQKLMRPQTDAQKIPELHSKLRNGLQDMSFTKYTGPKGWSFHGDGHGPYMRRQKPIQA